MPSKAVLETREKSGKSEFLPISINQVASSAHKLFWLWHYSAHEICHFRSSTALPKFSVIVVIILSLAALGIRIMKEKFFNFLNTQKERKTGFVFKIMYVSAEMLASIDKKKKKIPFQKSP